MRVSVTCRTKKVSRREGPGQEVMRCRLCGPGSKGSTDIAMAANSGTFPTAVGCDHLTISKCTGNLRLTSVDSQEDLGDPRRTSLIQGIRRKQVFKKMARKR